MYMNYVTVDFEGKERLIAVAGSATEASQIMHHWIQHKGGARVLTLNQLFDNHVEIPRSLGWIVESDKKFQKKVIDDRMKNLFPAP